MTLNTMRYLA